MLKALPFFCKAVLRALPWSSCCLHIHGNSLVYTLLVCPWMHCSLCMRTEDEVGIAPVLFISRGCYISCLVSCHVRVVNHGCNQDGKLMSWVMSRLQVAVSMVAAPTPCYTTQCDSALFCNAFVYPALEVACHVTGVQSQDLQRMKARMAHMTMSIRRQPMRSWKGH